jgi:FkbM family methyltransferase
MTTIRKKFKTLMSINWKALYRFFKKRLRHQIDYRTAQIRGIRSYPVRVGDITIDLSFHAPYHHARAKAFSLEQWDEIPLLPLWVEEAKRSSLIFDVGGYNGIYGLLAAKANPNAKVYIFELSPINADHIRRNVRMNNVHCTVVQAAVSDHDGMAKFSGDGGTGARMTDWGEQEVKMVRLSTFGSPDLLKVDVEGHEPEVLRGANISNTKIIFIEMNHELPLKGYREVMRSDITAVFKR